jgi:reactive intermediate/imine deaminase
MTTIKQVNYINPKTLPAPSGYSHVVDARNGRMIFISGQLALNKDGQVVGLGDMAVQTKQVFENIKAALEAAQASFDDVVKLTYFVTDISQIQVVRDIRNKYLNTANPPASTAVEVRQLSKDHFLIEVEAIAIANP